MQTIVQLRQMQDRMADELARNPQYRALKAMERFICEMSLIYEEQSESNDAKRGDFQDRLAQAVESRLKSDPGVAPTARVTPYVPAQRVA